MGVAQNADGMDDGTLEIGMGMHLFGLPVFLIFYRDQIPRGCLDTSRCCYAWKKHFASKTAWFVNQYIYIYI
jgi:hypothetical protein